MIKQLLLSTLAYLASMQALAADDPGRLYMLGDATPAGWTNWHPYALDRVDLGVYVYEGGLTSGELKFTNEAGNWGTAFAPSANYQVGDGVTECAISADNTDDRKWRINTPGRYRITVDVRNETFKAERLGDLPECIYILGDAVDTWDSTQGHPVYRRPDGKYVYQTWMYRDGADGKTFKFTYGNQTRDEAEFYVPASAANDGDLCEISSGQHSMKSAKNGNGPIDSFWRVRTDGVYRVTVDLNNGAPSFTLENVYRTYGLNGYDDNIPAMNYWMAYEQCYTSNQPLDEWRFDANVKWLKENDFRDYGYEMVCTDGWIEGAQSVNKNGYITKYNSGWDKTLADQVRFCEEHGFQAGFYYDPLWMPRAAYDANCRIAGRDDKRTRDIKGDTNFNDFIYWVDADKDGAEQWVKGFVRYIINQGFKFLRIDFLNWYENSYGIDRYQKALRWIMEEARDEIWVSLVMPNCYDHAWAEQRNSDMFRISEDVFGGGFDFVSGRRRDQWQNGWANWGNLYNGFLDFSDIERHKTIMDGDFVRLNTCTGEGKYSAEYERQFWLSLLVMAGSPIAIADQFDSPGVETFKHLYCNRTLTALSREGFYGRPVSREPSSLDSYVWHGSTASGKRVVAFFNRDDNRRILSYDLNAHTSHSCAQDVYDVWQDVHLADFRDRIELMVEPHQCRFIIYTPADETGSVTSGSLGMLGVADDAGTSSNEPMMLDRTIKGTYVWEGLLISHGNIWNNRLFNFVESAGDWDKVNFLVPDWASADTDRQNVEDGKTYAMKRISGAGQPLGASWTVNWNDNGRYRIEVNTDNLTFTVTRIPDNIYALGNLAGEFDSRWGVEMQQLASCAEGDAFTKILTISPDNRSAEGKDLKFTINRAKWQDAYFLLPTADVTTDKTSNGVELQLNQPIPYLLRSRRFTRGYNNDDDYSANDMYLALDQQDHFWTLPSFVDKEAAVQVNTRNHTVTLVGDDMLTGMDNLDAPQIGFAVFCRAGHVIVTSAQALGQVSLFTIDGRLVARSATRNNYVELDAAIASGMYIVATDCGTKKIIIR